MIHEELLSIDLHDNEAIEASLAYPDAGGHAYSVLLCPPHPHFAGNMDNNVIKALYDYFPGQGIPVMRFNYRGAGRSRMNLPADLSLFDYWRMVEEQKEYHQQIEDTRVCLDYISRSFNSEVVLAGYSFGAIMAMIAGDRAHDVRSIVCIAPPLAEYDFTSFRAIMHKTCMVGSSGDFVYSKEQFMGFCTDMYNLGGSCFFDDCDHFFRGRERILAEKVHELVESEE